MQGVVHHFDPAAFHSCLVYPVQDISELGVVLVGFDPHMEYRLHLVQICQGLGREGGLDLFENGIDGVVEWCPFEDPDQVLVKVKGHELCKGKRRRDFKLEGVYESPAVAPLDSFGIQGESGRLEGFQVTVDSPCSGFFPRGNLGYGQSIWTGFNGPNNPPLTGQLIASHSGSPLIETKAWTLKSREKVVGEI
jgi:hypothetical protein